MSGTQLWPIQAPVRMMVAWVDHWPVPRTGCASGKSSDISLSSGPIKTENAKQSFRREECSTAECSVSVLMMDFSSSTVSFSKYLRRDLLCDDGGGQLVMTRSAYI